MGVLGKYLSNAREAKGLDLHDAAQQTRISISYLKALEAEDFAKLPGDVFVKGFLKNYAKYLNLPESEVLQKYNELRSVPSAAVPSAQLAEQPAEHPAEHPVQKKSSPIPMEPLLWGAAIILTIIIFLFTSTPEKREKSGEELPSQPAVHSTITSSVTSTIPEKLYLQVIALDDVWVLVRTDSGPQKKVLLKKDENVIWSADKRFSLSYGNVSAAKLLLNGEELVVNAEKNSVVRDLAVTAAGIAVPKEAPEKPRPLRARRQPQHVPVPDQPANDNVVSPSPAQPELPARTEVPQETPATAPATAPATVPAAAPEPEPAPEPAPVSPTPAQ